MQFLFNFTDNSQALYQMFGVLSDVAFIRKSMTLCYQHQPIQYCDIYQILLSIPVHGITGDDYTAVYLEDVPIGAMTDAKGQCQSMCPKCVRTSTLCAYPMP